MIFVKCWHVMHPLLVQKAGAQNSQSPRELPRPTVMKPTLDPSNLARCSVLTNFRDFPPLSRSMGCMVKIAQTSYI